MNLVRFDSIRLNLVLVVLVSVIPVLTMLLLSGKELREKEIQDAKIEALRLVRSFGEQQESVTLGVEQLLSTLSLVHDIHRDPSACAALFKALVKQHSTHSNFTLLALNGDVIASALPYSQANFSDQKHVAETIKTHRFAVGEYLVGKLSGEPVIAFSYPVLDRGGDLAGILTTSLKLGGYADMLDAAMLPEGTSLGIIDGKGTRLLFYPYKPETNPVGALVSQQARDELLGPAEEGVVQHTTQDGVRRYLAFRQLRLTPQDPPYLVITIGIPEAGILARADQVTKRYLLWFAVASGLSLVAALLVGKYGIINHLKRFADLAKRVGSGDLDAVSGMTGGSGTLNIVANAFDGMTKALKTRESERIRAEEALHRNETRFRMLFENAPLPYQSLDERGYFLDVNKKWLGTLGYAKEEVVGRWFGDFLGKDFVEHFDRNFPMFKQACEIDGVEFDMVGKTGAVIRVAFNGRVQLGDDGEFLRTHCIFTDITERKRAEAAMAASLREKDTLLREIHHRVKNNLQVISSLLSLQEDSLDNPEALEALASSRGRVFSMAMIHEQLYRARDLSEVDLDEYLKQFLPRLFTTYNGGHHIGLALEPSSITLCLDQAIPLGLIINELVTNALKHAFAGMDHGRIRVSAVLKDGIVTLVVADDGIGLPADYEEKKDASLGLQIVTLLTRQLRGKLSVEIGPGTSFTLTFPHRASAP